MYVVGVSRQYLNPQSNHRRGTRQYWFLFYYDDGGMFHKERISVLKVPYYKAQIRRVREYTCCKCGATFQAVAGAKRADVTRLVPCPGCGHLEE